MFLIPTGLLALALARRTGLAKPRAASR